MRTYEHLAPVVIVRARTVRDTKINIPNIVDQVLAGNLAPTNRTLSNATMVAIAKTVIVIPGDLVDRVLDSSSDADLLFFDDFYRSYLDWLNYKKNEVSTKKSGLEAEKAGNE